MVSFRLRHRLDGGHVRVIVWSSEFGPDTTHGRNGELVFRPSEWEAFRRMLGADTLPPGGPVVAFVDEGAPNAPLTIPRPEACPTCTGTRTVAYDIGDQTIAQPCPTCCCLTCAKPTDTPPQCADCWIASDAQYERRLDR